MISPDKHNRKPPKGAFCLMGVSYCDLEGLAAGAGQKKSGRALPRGDKHKANHPERRSLPFWMVRLMTRASKPCSWTKEKKSGSPSGRSAFFFVAYTSINYLNWVNEQSLNS